MQAMHDRAMGFIREQSKTMQCFDFKQFTDASFPMEWRPIFFQRQTRPSESSSSGSSQSFDGHPYKFMLDRLQL